MTIELPTTSGQTVGPFFGYALPFAGGSQLVPPGTQGAIRLSGKVLDGAGVGVPDALLEIWQTAPDGSVVQRSGSLHRDGWTFTGWGRTATDNDGTYSFSTLRPGPSAHGQAPFFAVTVFARGLLNRLFTRIYLPDHDAALATDPLLTALPAARRATLIAKLSEQGYHFDIVLQGGTAGGSSSAETVFLRYPRHGP